VEGCVRPLNTQHKKVKKTSIKSIGATLLLPFKTQAAPMNASAPKSSLKEILSSATALALVGAIALLVPQASATPQSGVTSVTIAQGAFDDIDVFAKTDLDPGVSRDFWKAMINTKGASHLYVLQNTVVPGGSFGWHSHTGPSLVMVISGTATEYEGNDPTSTPTYHPAGTTFVDAGEASGHLVRNDGTVNLVVIVVRLVPEGAVQRVDLPNPGYLPTLN
jgi:quercetin dioxygenase-like cupin family protein